MNSEDEKLLAKHSVKIDTICSLLRDTQTDIKAYSDKLDHKFEHIYEGLSSNFKLIHKKIETKTDNILFRWAIGIIFISILSGAATVSYNSNQITELKKDAQFIKKYNNDKHSNKIEMVYK